MFCHRRSSTSSSKHHALILQIQISNQCIIMAFQCIKCPIVAVPCDREKRRFYVLSGNAAVIGTEAVYHYFELCGHSIVVKKDAIGIGIEAHQFGYPRMIVSYCSIFSTWFLISGRACAF